MFNVFLNFWRLSLKQEHPDLFAVIAPIAHKVIVLVWGTCCKHQTHPEFLKQNMKEVGLVLPAAKCQAVVDAGEDWVQECSQEVLDMVSDGPLGEALFSHKVKDIVSSKLASTLDERLIFLWDKAVADKAIVGETHLQAWRDIMLDAAAADVQSLSILPAKRVIGVKYRQHTVKGITVTSLATQVDLMIVSRMKAAAIYAEVLPAMDAEDILGFRTAPADAAQKIDPAFFDKVLYILFL